MLHGRALIDHALEQLSPHVEALAVVGRDMPGTLFVADWPEPGLGPLGGLAGALRHAAAHGFDAVLSCGVDCPDFPAELLRRAPCYLAEQPVIGLWPASAAEDIARFIAGTARHSVRDFAAAIGAVPIATGPLPNINTVADLERLEAGGT